MANALQFIESDQEDLEPAEKKRRAIEEIKEIMEKTTALRNSESILQRVSEEDAAPDFVIVVRDILKRADQAALSTIDRNTAQFLDYTQQRYQQVGVKWEDLILEFEWFVSEVPKIKDVLAGANLSELTKTDIEVLIKKQPTFFDAQTVKDFVRHHANVEVLDG